jgi:hypothetical protein
MSVSQAIIVAGALIAGAIFFIPVPRYSLMVLHTGGVLKLDTTTGKTSVCTPLRYVDEGYYFQCNKPR